MNNKVILLYKIYRKLIVCLLPLFIIYNYSIKVNGIENDNILNVTQTIMVEDYIKYQLMVIFSHIKMY